MKRILLACLTLPLPGVLAAAWAAPAGAAGDAPPAMTPEARAEEIRAKEGRLLELMQAERLDGVLVATQRNFAWLTAGGDNHVLFNTEEGSAALLWTPDRRHVIVGNNEIARLTEEELAGLGYEPASFLWHDDLARGARVAAFRRLADGRRIGADIPLAGMVDVGAKIAALRAQLTPNEIERYRWLARTTAMAVEAVAGAITPGMTEQEIQAEVARRLFLHDILPTVLFVGADDRIAKFKHPITKRNAMRREAMITVCGRKWGLVIAVTRHVYFGPLPPEMQRRQEALGRIYAAMVGATKAGSPANDVLAEAQRVYAEVGFADAWEAHHLGGATGYREREYRVYPGFDQPIRDRQAFAWNPTLPGIKAEDTLLVNGDMVETLTDTGTWPRAEFEARGGGSVHVPQILVR